MGNIIVISSDFSKAKIVSQMKRDIASETYYVYLIKCSDNTFYTGITSDLVGRLESHQKGKFRNSYTYSRRPLKLVYHCKFSDPNKAIEKEKQIKKWSKQKKEALITGEYDKLPDLSKKKFFR